MKLTNWFLNFDFSGRGRRSHSWANWAAWIAVWIVLMITVSAIGAGGATAEGGSSVGAAVGGILMLVVAVVSMIDNMAMTFRRAHDTGKSGWIWLMLLIPLVNLLALYWLLIEDSQQGPNKYGPAVKQFYEPTVSAS
jgi:uncharacterized membrane protein YhaH (DUF805 family)